MKLFNSSKLILTGYGLLALFLIVSILTFQGYNKQTEQLYKQLLISQDQANHIQKMQIAAKDRSIYLSRLILESDQFIQDEYMQKFYLGGERFGSSRNALKTDKLSVQQYSKLASLDPLIMENSARQREVFNLIQQEKRNEAIELYLTMLPYQTTILETLIELSEELALNSRQAEQNYLKIVTKDEQLSSVLNSTLFISIILLGLFSYRQAKEIENTQNKELQTLSNEVALQIKLNEMDAHILHAVDEYIILANNDGQIIRSNPRFEELHKNTVLSEFDSIWSILEKFTQEAFIANQIKTQLKEHTIWRQEFNLITPFNFFALCEITRFKSQSIVSADYLISIKDISELKEAQKAIEHQANYDAVTTLPNRHFFQQTLAEQTQEHQNHLALLYIDLDDFKNINDTLGHEFGDKLLQTVSYRMQNVLLEYHLNHFHLARIGGDEFAIILRLNKSLIQEKSIELAQKLIEIVKHPYELSNQNLEIGCSIGIAFYPEQARSATKLMRHADLAMYEAKHQGKNQFVTFNTDIERKLEERILLKHKLLQGLQNNEFCLYYQPQYNLKTMQIVGLEALIRWNNNELNYTPDDFIPFAEENGIIHFIDDYVVDKVSKHVSDWLAEGINVPRIAVNISSQQVNSDNFVEMINSKLQQYQYLGKQLELEITEYSLVESLQNRQTQDNWFDQLRNLNIHIAIDDFGTGYSSLSYLHNMRINRLKIDRSFIQDINQVHEKHCIIESIISLGHTLKASVLAEGIETEEQLQQLIKLGCDEGQGYLMSPPISVEKVHKLLKSSTKH